MREDVAGWWYIIYFGRHFFFLCYTVCVRFPESSLEGTEWTEEEVDIRIFLVMLLYTLQW